MGIGNGLIAPNGSDPNSSLMTGAQGRSSASPAAQGGSGRRRLRQRSSRPGWYGHPEVRWLIASNQQPDVSVDLSPADSRDRARTRRCHSTRCLVSFWLSAPPPSLLGAFTDRVADVRERTNAQMSDSTSCRAGTASVSKPAWRITKSRYRLSNCQSLFDGMTPGQGWPARPQRNGAAPSATAVTWIVRTAWAGLKPPGSTVDPW